MNYSDELLSIMKKFYHSLSEKDRRRYAAIEAKKLGHGGISYISEVFGCSRDTIKLGMTQLESMNLDALRKAGIRKPGAGRKRALDSMEGLEDAFYEVLQEHNPEEYKLSQRRMALLLEKRGFRVSGTVVKQLVEKYQRKT